MTARREAVSIVCVFNDPMVRQRCLDRSIDLLQHEVADVDYVPVDNVGGAFPTAGAALNHGVSRARHDYVVFVHQDVHLHSLVALEEAAGILAGDNGFGVLGTFGFAPNGDPAGFIRDRVVLLGSPISRPIDVDSLDEVLFMAPRRLLRQHPLTESPDLAWHAYAIEYGLRARSLGLRVGAAAIPVTHNSLTVNLDRLNVAHRAVAAAYPNHLPVRTTCGTITTSEAPTRTPLLQSQRWRYRWAKGSVAAHAVRRAAGSGSVVLNDIRLDIDSVIAGAPEPFRVFNVDPSGTFRDGVQGPLELYRRDRKVLFSAGGTAELHDTVRSLNPSHAALLTNLDDEQLHLLRPSLKGRGHVIGLHEGFGCWILLGTTVVPVSWRSRRATPFGMSALAR